MAKSPKLRSVGLNIPRLESISDSVKTDLERACLSLMSLIASLVLGGSFPAMCLLRLGKAGDLLDDSSTGIFVGKECLKIGEKNIDLKLILLKNSAYLALASLLGLCFGLA